MYFDLYPRNQSLVKQFLPLFKKARWMFFLLVWCGDKCHQFLQYCILTQQWVLDSKVIVKHRKFLLVFNALNFFSEIYSWHKIFQLYLRVRFWKFCILVWCCTVDFAIIYLFNSMRLLIHWLHLEILLSTSWISKEWLVYFNCCIYFYKILRNSDMKLSCFVFCRTKQNAWQNIKVPENEIYRWFLIHSRVFLSLDIPNNKTVNYFLA